MIGGLILAAGGAHRFGGGKLVAELGGRPLLDHAISAMRKADGVDRIVVVVGADGDAVREGAHFGGAEVVEAEEWERGISASLRRGIVELSDCDAVVVTLGDQPLITAESISMALEHLREAAGAPAACATYDGAPGHPVAILSTLFDEVRALEGDTGAQDLLEHEGVVTFEAGEMAEPDDVDTKEDLEAIRERLSAGRGDEERR